MEAKINIAEILKDKPMGTKLYDLLRNIDVELDKVHITDVGSYIECTSTNEVGSTLMFDYSKLGTEESWLDGLQILLPSKEMRDWRKFLWKKGDVLISNDSKKEVFFNGFTDNTYVLFKAKHGFEVHPDGSTMYLGDEDYVATDDYVLEDKDAAKIYINTIEERLNGKLNRETLEIEPSQPEFKDGDILLYKSAKFTFFSSIFILCTNRNKMCSYVRFSIGKGSIDYDVPVYSLNIDRFRYATEEEKQQLFDALAKEGKAWDAEKKQVVDLKPKCELKPFDKLLCRDDIGEEWHIDLFESMVTHNSKYNYKCMANIWKFCIPYEGNEHLLGTTKDVEG